VADCKKHIPVWHTFGTIRRNKCCTYSNANNILKFSTMKTVATIFIA